MSIYLKGNWNHGWALDVHTVDSRILPDGHFDNTRTQIGESLYRLKYCEDFSQLDFLANEIFHFLQSKPVFNTIDVVFPTPASKFRTRQPVFELAELVSRFMNKPYDPNFIHKVKGTPELKSNDISPEDRKTILANAFSVADPNRYRHKKVLIIDDTYRSGSTLNVISQLLYRDAGVSNIYVVALTKTRVHR